MRSMVLAVLLVSMLPLTQPSQASAASQCPWWCGSNDPGGDDWRDEQRQDSYATELRDELRELRQDLSRQDLKEFRDDLDDLLSDLRRSDRREVRDEVRAIRRALQWGDIEALREAFNDLRRELRDETRGAAGNSRGRGRSSDVSNSRGRGRSSDTGACPDGWRLASSTADAMTCVRR